MFNLFDAARFIPGVGAVVGAAKAVSDIAGDKDVIPGFDPFTNRSKNTSKGTRNNATSQPLNDSTPDTRAVLGANTSGSGGSRASYDPAQLAAYDQAIGIAQSALDRAGGQLNTALANIGDQYRVQQNELNSNRAQAQNNYNTSTTQNRQNLRTDKNVIADQTSQGLRGLLRQLGAFGAGGSSDALYVAPQAVADAASVQRAGAGQTFAQNQSSLDTNWNNFQTQDEQERDKLNDWRSIQERTARQTIENNKQSILQRLAELQGARTSLMGGNAVAAAQPFIDQINASANQVDSLARFSPTYSGTRPVYNAPELDSYVAEAVSPATIAPSSQGGGATPFLSLLLGQQDERNQLPRF